MVHLPFASSVPEGLGVVTAVAQAAAGAALVLWFFKSVIRVGILNQRYRDPLAACVGRAILWLFRIRMAGLERSSQKAGQIMSWYWPCTLVAVIACWFLLVTLGFALLNLATRAEPAFFQAFVASGSALSTLGFSTPSQPAGQLLAILEGAIGLFLIVYLFTFLPGFMDLIHQRGCRVEWIYSRAGHTPSGPAILAWFARNGRLEDLPAVWEDWETFFRDIAQARSFLSILAFIRPLDPRQSWVCAFGAFLDAVAFTLAAHQAPGDSARLCFECGVTAIKNFQVSLRGSPLAARTEPGPLHVQRADFDAACTQLEASGVELMADRDAAWDALIRLHMRYEDEIAWLAETLNDPRPSWGMGSGDAKADQPLLGKV